MTDVGFESMLPRCRPKATAEDASMWFVRHSIDDPEEWKQFVSEYFSVMKGQTMSRLPPP
jgi:hypothetical protein